MSQPSKRSRCEETDESASRVEGAVATMNLQSDSGRKRNREPTDLDNIQRLRLEAIFHPKFENERSDQQIREQMKAKVANGEGYLEVTLKHSGSLLLWSGDQRYYSKNSTDNKYTYVGEILLRQHFVRAYWKDIANATDGDIEKMYRECSNCVVHQRLTLAFEVVTAVLGDHGARPNRDFLILTAVADRSRARFYSTSEMVSFAQKFRLPHNDCFVYQSLESVNRFFDFYDSSRETGLASDVIRELTGISDCHICSLYPHPEFQGEIIEGLVVRYVPFEHGSSLHHETVDSLASHSKILRDLVPPSLTDGFSLVRQLPCKLPAVLSTDIRESFRETFSTETKPDKSQQDAFEAHLRLILESHEDRRSIVRFSHTALPDIPALTSTLVDSDDRMTHRIAAVIQGLVDINARVDFTVCSESSKGSPARWLCVVHVLFDKAFQKFGKRMKTGSMPLFRGFVIELCDTLDQDEHMDDPAELQEWQSREDILMLKMKFVNYMVRTFACRNGLSIIRQGGPDAFLKYSTNLLSNWNISNVGKQKWMLFFEAWAEYAFSCLNGKRIGQGGYLRDLSESNYLDHLEYFKTMYDSGLFEVQASLKVKSNFRGLVVVVSKERQLSERLADLVANRLGGAGRIDNVDDISPESMFLFCEEGSGKVCSAVANDPVKKLRQLIRVFDRNISLILYECSENDIEKALLPSQEVKMTKGVLKEWRKTQFLHQFELSGNLFSGEGINVINDVVSKLVGESKNLKPMDTRPGLLVFFPGIPGCGKSSLLNPDVENELRLQLPDHETLGTRRIITKVGDQTSGKFWQKVKDERFGCPSSIYIADKNVPANTWETVARIAASTKAVGVPILPDRSALGTTKIIGIRKPDASYENHTHIYPFSLSYLALCLARVISRTAGSHAGKLDSETKRACLIVIGFFGMYRRISGDEFFEHLKAKFTANGALVSSSPIEVPFFRQDVTKTLPKELEEILIEALQTQCGYDFKKVDIGKHEDPYLDSLEQRLRKALMKYSEGLFAMSTTESVSRHSFVTRLLERVAEVDTLSSYSANHVPFIKLASVDIDVDVLHKSLRWYENKESMARCFKAIGGDHATDELFLGSHSVDQRWISRTHVTLAHFRDISQDEMRAIFEPLEGSIVQVACVALLWSSKVAAVEVRLPEKTLDGKAVPASKNVFVHITLWLQEGASSVDANDLPNLLESGEAERVSFDELVMVEGTVTLWSL